LGAVVGVRWWRCCAVVVQAGVVAAGAGGAAGGAVVAAQASQTLVLSVIAQSTSLPVTIVWVNVLPSAFSSLKVIRRLPIRPSINHCSLCCWLLAATAWLPHERNHWFAHGVACLGLQYARCGNMVVYGCLLRAGCGALLCYWVVGSPSTVINTRPGHYWSVQYPLNIGPARSIPRPSSILANTWVQWSKPVKAVRHWAGLPIIINNACWPSSVYSQFSPVINWVGLFGSYGLGPLLIGMVP